MLDTSPILRYLQSSPKLITTQGLNVRFLKRIVELLPDDMPINDSSEKVLDEVFAIIFHTAFPLKGLLAKKWSDKHQYIPTGAVPELTQNERAAAIDLLSSLGLLKPAEPIKRRI